MSQLTVGVIGVGHLGARHAEIYAGMDGVRLGLVCDVDQAKVRAAAQRVGCEAVTDYRQAFGRIQAASLAVPSTLHGRLGRDLLRHGIHVLIEKPLATSLREADALIRTARQRQLTLQVGHVERFNTAIRAARERLAHPRFIEVHRLSPYPVHPSTGSERAGVPSATEARGTDVSVVLDVMIHDLDLLLALVRAPVTRVAAVGVTVLSRSEDIANARVEFASGCVANLTASRISEESVRRFRVFEEQQYLSIDTREQRVELAHLEGGAIRRVDLPVNKRPPLQDELAAFVDAVAHRRAPLVTGEDGRAALALALRIEAAMRRSRRVPARRA